VAITGYEKAAIFLTAVGEQAASEILKHLDSDVIGKVSSYMTKKSKGSRNDVENIFKEASEMISTGNVQLGGEEYVKKILSKGLGTEDAQKILEMVEKENPLDSLKWVSPKQLANFLVGEHPQTIALILCFLEPDRAAEIMTTLPEQLRSDVAMRVASTERIPESALADIEEVLRVQLDVGKGKDSMTFQGTKLIAEILNQCERSMESSILEAMEEEDTELATAIRELMLVFDDLEKIDDKGIQGILKEVSTEDLSLALKSASGGLKEKIFNNMSQRAVKILKEEIETKGPVKVSDVEKAQRNVVAIARKLEEEGTIIIAGKGGEEMVE
jgi:flagellar motor switch protein FliG